MRISEINRKTKETDIKLSLNLDNADKVFVSTGIGFFDHMLNSFAVHSGIGMCLETVGDLLVDCHHTVEDTGIVLGKAFAEALGDKSGINRYGFASIPMDESLAEASIDVSGRPFLVFNADFSDDKIGDFDTQVTEEFFRAFAFNAGITLHINLKYGSNDHHKCEAIFKAVAHAVKDAICENRDGVLSTKGVL
ncbi:MAG: imidazoleglycerol-phosphate dehydratase HisB [Oscillospiraceae bacterium]|nr:imidazoleglycerol-phosphate dehydratase HisB [Oscillospiraceae bacterium]